MPATLPLLRSTKRSSMKPGLMPACSPRICASARNFTEMGSTSNENRALLSANSGMPRTWNRHTVEGLPVPILPERNPTVKDFTRLSAGERQQIETARLKLLCAAAVLQGVLYDAHNPGVRGLVREHLNMLGSFVPVPELAINGIFGRIDDNRCPNCDNTPDGEDACECPEETVEPLPMPASTLPSGKLPNAAAARGRRNIGMEDEPEEYEPNPYEGTYSEE
jgi:hypothetical protein